MAALESKVTLKFLDFYFSYIPWVDDNSAILFHPISPFLVANLPQPNSLTNKNNKTIPSNSENELSLSFPSSK